MSARTSLTFRLMAANVLTKQVVILVAGLALLSAFKSLAYRQAERELDFVIAELSELAGRDTAEAARMMADFRYAGTQSTRYWQVSGESGAIARSASLGALAIALPHGFEPTAETQWIETAATGGEPVLAGVRQAGGKVVIVARSTAELEAYAAEFRTYVIGALGGIAALLLTSAWIQLKIGLKPAEALRTAIERIRTGVDRRLGDAFPDELKPLIDEANRLLEAQEIALEKARARAADLAHGLKTPLTAVGMLAERLDDRGESVVADEIREQIEIARRHIDRELSRSRIAAEHRNGFRTDVAAVAARVLSTMEKLPRGDDIRWVLSADRGTAVALEEADFTELLGNLLDNARKFARSTVRIKAGRKTDGAWIAVEDDGPGIDAGAHDAVLRRGVRLDESRPGQGLGLTIAKDIVEAYGGSIDLYSAKMGGLGVRLRLPAPRHAGAAPESRPVTPSLSSSPLGNAPL